MQDQCFNSSNMLPLFQIISPSSSRDSGIDIKEKGMNPDTKRRIYKHYRSANSVEDNRISEHEESEEQKIKISRKEIIKDLHKLQHDNGKLSAQLRQVQEALLKRDTQVIKVKEKFRILKSSNRELKLENVNVKSQIEEVSGSVEQLTSQLKAKCESCTDLKRIIKTQNTELENTKKGNKDLNLDLNMLKNVIYRLNVQLQRYQEKLGKTKPTTPSPLPEDTEIQSNEIVSHSPRAETHSTHSHTPISWGDVNTHTLGPLLDAYQDTISEKDDIIRNYEIELTNFSSKLKQIVKENECLHKRESEKEESMKENNFEIERYRREIKSTREQNELLIKKCSVKQDKFQQICQIYDRKINSMRNDFEVLQHEHHKSRVEFNSYQEKYSRLVNDFEILKVEHKNSISKEIHTSRINECKSLFEELKSKYDSEKQKIEFKTKNLENDKTELTTQITQQNAHIVKFEEKLKLKSQHLRKQELKITELKRLLTQTQLNRDACKRQLKKAVDFGRELVNDQDRLTQQLSNQSKENETLAHKESKTSGQLEYLRNQLKIVKDGATEQLSYVEERLEEKDSSIEIMQRNYESEMEKLRIICNEKDEYIGELESGYSPTNKGNKQLKFHEKL